MTVEIREELLDGVPVARLVLDRTERANALDATTVEELHAGLDRAEQADAAMVVVEARGPSFCGGLDLRNLDDESDASLLLRLVRIQLLLERLQHHRALTVSVVGGPAVGAGADLVLATHVRLAHGDASLRFPGSGFGAVLGIARLAGETSPSYAAELATTARRVRASEASARGLWRLLDTADAVEPELRALAGSAARLPGGTGAALRAASRPSAPDPLGALVRSVAGRPGLRDRVATYRDRSNVAPKPTPQGATR